MKQMTIEIVNFIRVAGMFEGVANRAKNDYDAMEAIGVHGRKSVIDTFLAQGRPLPWEHLSESTIQKRRRRGNFNETILRDTDETYLSFYEGGNEFTIFDIADHEVSWGSSREDFIYHDEGTSTEPQRQVLQHLPEDVEIYSQLYLDFLVDPFLEG